MKKGIHQEFCYWVFATVFILSQYNASVLSLMQQIYRYHKLEFTNHIKQMLVLFIATNVSLLLFLQMQLYSFWDLICLKAKYTGEAAMFDYEDENDSSFCP